MIEAKLSNDGQKVSPEDLHPLYRKLVKIIGLENALLFGREFGGQSIYFPKVDAAILLKAKHRMMFEEFDGRNYGELAKKYGFTEMWTRRIIERQRKAK